MPIFVRHVVQYIRAGLTGWRLPMAIAVFVFATSWAAMALVEPPGAELVEPANYWWYFVVTAATVGYGDLYPETLAGRVVGGYVIVGGIVALTVLFTKLADHISSVRGRRRKGAESLELERHVVLLGYTPGRTERLVAELTAEGRLEVALCAWDEVAVNPMPDQSSLRFVRGDLANADVMERAGVERARTAIIDGRDDNETLAIAVAVDHANPDIHMVAALRDLGRREQFGYVNPNVQCVQWHMPYLLTEEAVDPGITQVYNDLMSSGGHGNTYSLRVPQDFPHATFGDSQTHFGRAHGATLLAIRTVDGLVVGPAWDTPVEDGTTLYYVGRRRLTTADFAS